MEVLAPDRTEAGPHVWHAPCSLTSDMTEHDLFDALEKATTHAATIAESGPLTERSPSPAPKSRSPRVRVSGTFLVGENQAGELLRSYLVQESHQKKATSESIRWVAQNLRELCCPDEFIRRVELAAVDKLRQGEILAQAARFSRETTAPPDGSAPPTDLWGLTLAIATERCVVDTYAAARFAFQARRAASSELRATFHDIARQDALHATLFWGLLAWALSHLSPARARQIIEEQRNIRNALRQSIEVPLPEELHELAGVPDADAGHALLDVLEIQLWSEVAA